MTTRLLHGDARTILPTLPDNSVHACITSPPYYNLRSYLAADHPDKAREIGSEATPEDYLATMVGVFREVRRILRDDGCVFCNLGDSYSSGLGAKGQADGGIMHGNSRAPDRSLPAKNLLMMPARLAIALQADGWWLRSMLPWLKRSAMPESVTDRPASAVEYVFLLTKSARYFWDAEAVKRGVSGGARPGGEGYGQKAAEPGSGNRSNHGFKAAIRNVTTADLPSSRNMRNSDLFYDSLEMEPEPAAKLHTPGTGERKARGEPPGVQPKIGSRVAPWVVREPDVPLGLICDPTTGEPLALDVNPAAFSASHFATFPPKLVEPLIRAGTSQYGCCAACGAPWVRVTERNSPSYWEQRKAHDFTGRKAENAPNDNAKSISRGRADNSGVGYSDNVTTGWSASCECAAGTKPCVVLDIFAGAGTTLLVADRLQRDAIGIELSDAYGTMATARVAQDAPLFAGVLEEPVERNALPKEITGPRHDGNSWAGGVAPPPKPARVVDDTPLLAWLEAAE